MNEICLRAQFQKYLLALSLVCLGVACQKPPEKEIRIGVMSPQGSPGGLQMIKAVEMVAAQVNKAGGLQVAEHRYKITLIIENTAGNPQKAVAAGHHLIEKEKVQALIGPNYSRTTLPMAAIAERSQIPLISPAATHGSVTQGKNFVFGVARINSIQSHAMVNFARNHLNAHTAAVLFDVANQYACDMAKNFKQGFEDRGGEVVAYENFTTGTNDFRTELRRIGELEPDVLFLPNYTVDLIKQARQLRELGYSPTLLGSDGWSPLGVINNADLEGAYFTHQWHPVLGESRQKDKAFVTEFKQAYNETPYPLAALAYDAINILLQGIEKAQSTDPKIFQKTLAATDGFAGITGNISYVNKNDEGECFVFHITKGQVEYSSTSPAGHGGILE